VAGALAVLHEHLKAGNAALAAGDVSGVYREQVLVRSMLDVLGLDPASEQWRGQAGIGAGASGAAAAEHSALDALIQSVLSERAAARAAKDWGRADELRDRLAAAGITVADGRDGATWSVG
ncbi:CysS/YqeB C-terminal domain-containing protein, partial [Actinomyces sp.]